MTYCASHFQLERNLGIIRMTTKKIKFSSASGLKEQLNINTLGGSSVLEASTQGSCSCLHQPNMGN